MTTLATTSEPRIDDGGSGGPAAGPDGGPAISVRDVGHAFAADAAVVEALRGISLEIPAGQFVSLVGKSGCGKSTLLNILAGLLTPSSGQISVRGSGLPGLPNRGYITQDSRLLPWRTALQNVALPLELHGVRKKERLDRARRLLERVGLGDATHQRPDQLSGGMRQRVAIAQALVYEPAVLLMDEPFGALDVWTRESLHDLLLDVQAELGTTAILVTHDVGEAISLSDRIVTLAPRPGRILGDYTIAGSKRPRRHDALRDDVLADLQTRIRRDLGAAA
jgi:NitT/TauT family transport system ATP-binding protein